MATPLLLSQEIYDGIPGAYWETFAGVGHHAPIEAPAETTGLIDEFLKN